MSRQVLHFRRCRPPSITDAGLLDSTAWLSGLEAPAKLADLYGQEDVKSPTVVE
jgi:hypothetical protein